MQSLKQEIRRRASANRQAQPDKDRLSRLICEKFASLPEYAAANTVMVYVDFDSEVRTRRFLPTALEQKQRIVVPYCLGNQLELFRLESMDELAIGTYKIMEPKVELRALGDRKIEVTELDLIMVPGVAFDRQGARAGHGKGYYDRLLRGARADTPLVALAFECQLFPEIPTHSQDIYMDKVITEKAIYQGRRRNREGGRPKAEGGRPKAEGGRRKGDGGTRKIPG